IGRLVTPDGPSAKEKLSNHKQDPKAGGRTHRNRHLSIPENSRRDSHKADYDQDSPSPMNILQHNETRSDGWRGLSGCPCFVDARDRRGVEWRKNFPVSGWEIGN